MRVLFDVTHPAHVHLFRNVIDELQALGHDTVVTSREKDVTVDLLDHYRIQHRVISAQSSGVPGTAVEWLRRSVRLLQIARSVDPDVVVSRFNPASTAVASALGCPCLLFDDTEHKPAALKRITYPLSDRVYTPTSFDLELGANQVRYDGYHELAYLHPDRFEPDPTVLADVGVDETDQLVVVRLVSWLAPHDVGQSGFDDVLDAVKTLEAAGATVVITAEADVPDRLERYRVPVAVHELHDLLYYADLFIGESGTMTIESATLGTPAIFVSSIELGVIEELHEAYGLVFRYRDGEKHRKGLEKAVEILSHGDERRWERRRERLLEEKIDTTEFAVNEIRRYGHGQ